MGENSKNVKVEERAKLYVVATAIGNLADLSFRAVETLQSVDLIFAEDTRKFRRLAERHGIETKCASYHEHNEKSLAPKIVERLREGLSVALVSEAGTPTISDPGFRLVKLCQDEGIPVSPIPGPCAGIAALSISGFPTHRFTYEGFLPPRSGKRSTLLSEALVREGTTIFYESPHRILKTLKALCEIDADSEIFLARELTKLHEETLSGSAEEVLAELERRPSIKGEFVLLLKG